MTIWAYEELMSGINWFRHLLGAAYGVIMGYTSPTRYSTDRVGSTAMTTVPPMRKPYLTIRNVSCFGADFRPTLFVATMTSV